MRCAIMQPTYFPWAGYFNLMTEVDVFVFLDDVQFEKRSWQSRNRVLINGNPHWITVPVKAESQSEFIKNIRIDDTTVWREKHCKLLQHTYAKCSFANQLREWEDMLLNKSLDLLADLNICIIQELASKLKLDVKFYRASDLGVGGKRSEHLLNICNAVECNQYLSPNGSRQYLEEDGVFANSTIQLLFQNYIPKPYKQRGSAEFVSHLSILDIMANLEWNTIVQYVRT